MTNFRLALLILSTVVLLVTTEGYLTIKNRLEEPIKPEQVVKVIPTNTLIKKASATKPTEEETQVKAKPKKNILLLGSDTRVKDQISRSDAIMVLQLDPDTRTINYISIPRDAYVDIVGKGYKDKINHAMAYGIDYSVDTITKLLDIDIDNYFVIDFFSFEKVIDDLGGIEIDAPFSFTEQNAQGKQNAIRIKEGLNTLNGEETLAYARMRKQDSEGDLGRAKRQQQIVDSIMTRFASTTNYEKIKVMKNILSEVKTDLSLKDVVNYTDYLYNYTNINKHVLSGNGTMIDGVYYMVLDNSLEEAINLLSSTQVENKDENKEHNDTVIDNKTHLQ